MFALCFFRFNFQAYLVTTLCFWYSEGMEKIVFWLTSWKCSWRLVNIWWFCADKCCSDADYMPNLWYVIRGEPTLYFLLPGCILHMYHIWLVTLVDDVLLWSRKSWASFIFFFLIRPAFLCRSPLCRHPHCVAWLLPCKRIMKCPPTL